MPRKAVVLGGKDREVTILSVCVVLWKDQLMGGKTSGFSVLLHRSSFVKLGFSFLIGQEGMRLLVLSTSQNCRQADETFLKS